jgi:hypothetical protein
MAGASGGGPGLVGPGVHTEIIEADGAPGHPPALTGAATPTHPAGPSPIRAAQPAHAATRPAPAAGPGTGQAATTPAPARGVARVPGPAPRW